MERKKVIFLLSRFPYPLIKGDKLRAYHQIRECSAQCDVYLFALSDERVSETDLDALRPYCKEIRIFKLSYRSVAYSVVIHLLFSLKPVQVGYFYNARQLSRILKAVEEIRPDHVFCQLIRTAEYGRRIDGIPRTLDYMDALSAGMGRRMESAPTPLRWIFRIEARRLKRYEDQVYKSFDAATVISPSDRDLISHYEKENIIILPNGVDAVYFSPRQSKLRDVLK